MTERTSLGCEDTEHCPWHIAGPQQIVSLESLPLMLPHTLAVPDTEGRLHGKPEQGTGIKGKGLTDLGPVAVVQEVSGGQLLQAQPQVHQTAHHHLDLYKATKCISGCTGAQEAASPWGSGSSPGGGRAVEAGRGAG